MDHYALDINWEKSLRAEIGKIMVVDDLANREHDCDIIIDQNLGREIKDYEQLVPRESAILCGPKYALIRKQFSKLRNSSLARRKFQKLKKY